MAPDTLPSEYAALRKSLNSIRALVTSFHAALESSSQALPDTPDGSPLPFAVLTDASKLLKAQITKLSLLVINKPFSPKEVSFILNVLGGSVLPALMSGLELCHPDRYTRALYQHIRTILRVLWRELGSFLASVPEDGTKAKQIDDKAILSSTGLIWGYCDVLTELCQGGLIKFVDAKVKGYYDLFEDAIAELEEWDPDDDDDEEEESESEGNGQKVNRNVIRTPTTSDEEALGQGIAQLALNPQYELKSKIMKRLRLIKLLYPAIRKRRISSFPAGHGGRKPEATPAQTMKLDRMILHMHRFTEIADELAAALYDNSVDDLESTLVEMSDEISQCITLTTRDWNDTDDEFSIWFSKWNDRFQDVCGSARNIP